LTEHEIRTLRVDVSDVAPAGVLTHAADVHVPAELSVGPVVCCCVPGGGLTAQY
jgi:hypothetical protein